ncbi:tetratricopeptide repeat protein [Thermaurantiacus sp.]
MTRALLLLLALLPAEALASARAETALAAYLRGRVAAGEDDIGRAAASFGLALATERTVPELRQNAFETALVAGDMKTMARLAEELAFTAPVQASPSRFGFGPAIAALARASVAAAARDWRGFDSARAGFRDVPTGGTPVISILLDAWSRAARGQWNDALALLRAEESNPLARSYFLEHRAHILALARRWGEAADAYGQIVAAEGANVPRLRLQAAAVALEAARAEPAHAAAWREKAILLLAGGPPGDPLLADARARLAATPGLDGRRLGGLVQSPGEGLALMFVRLAVDASRERPQPVSIAFGRLATLVAPQMPEAWLVTGDMLSRQGLGPLALSAFERVGPGPYARAARVRRGQVLVESGDRAGALAVFSALASEPGASFEDWVRVSDVQRQMKDFAAAAQSLSRAIALLPDPKSPETAWVWFLRGTAYEQGGDWTAAEPDLRRAVELQGENAIFLNYLGYSLLDRNLNLDEADLLIARAFKAAPDNGAIIDSMGWSKFVRGHYAEAVELLEQARAAEPADPTVADHLGDALWRVGRRIEARHAWASALTLEPEDKLKESIERKLAVGLDLAVADRALARR